MVESTSRVQLLRVPDCPNVDGARELLKECLSEIGAPAVFEELEGDFPSPTILVDGVDVMGAPATAGASCRLDVPTRERVLEALRSAAPS